MRAEVADGIRRSLPEFRVRRQVDPVVVPSFAQQVSEALIRSRSAPAVAPATAPSTPATAVAPAPGLEPSAAYDPLRGRNLPPERAEMIGKAHEMLGIPYLRGGDTLAGLDCSAYLSRVWGVSRQTTDTLPGIAVPVAKEDLLPGDALNLPTWKDADRFGHVRLFDRWADPERTRMWVYEETAVTRYAVHRVIDYDPAYQPLRLKRLAA
ncbi:MAG: hypothetical protein FJ033_08405 [Chloroflexi bacterium]|nr:hypothetical protein [Chloroflexota bacterium]